MLKALALDQQISCGRCGSRMSVGKGSNSCILGQRVCSHNCGTLVLHSHKLGHSRSKIHKSLKALVLVQQMLRALALGPLIFCGRCDICRELSRESNSCILEQHSNHEGDTPQVSHNHGHSKKFSHNKALKALVQALLMLKALVLGQLTSCGGGGCHSHM